MKIAFIDSSDLDYTVESAYQIPLGGSQSGVCYLAENLVKFGHEVFLLNCTSTPGWSRGVLCLRLPLEEISPQLLRSLDVVILVNITRYISQVRQLLGDRPRLILWAHQLPTLKMMEGLHDASEREVYDGFAFVSEWQRQQFQQAFGIDRDRSAVLKNAIAPAFQNLFPADTSIRLQKSRSPILAYTSTPFRGLDLLLSVFPQIRAAVPGTTLKVFSSKQVYQVPETLDKSTYGSLYRQCREMPGVEYRGSVSQPQLARELRSVSILAYPNTFQETSCIAVMEAMASGCRIVTSNLAALPETCAGFARLVSVKDGIQFSSVRNWQVSLNPDWKSYGDRFVEATIEVLRDCLDGSGENLLRQQVDYINHSFSWEVRATEWIDWLSDLCKGRGDKSRFDSSGESFVSTQAIADRCSALNQQAESYYGQGKLSEAIAVCQESLKLSPSIPRTYQLLGKILHSLGKIDAANRAYQTAVLLQSECGRSRS